MSHSAESLLAGIGRELPLVDREEELALLKSLFEQTIAGKGQVVFVAGEGGIGKTRLVNELGRQCKSRGAVFAVGPSYEEEGLVPYSPWIEAIRAIVNQTSAEIFGKTLGRTAAEVGRLVPELAVRATELGIKGWLSGPQMGELISATDAERVRLFQAVTDFVSYTSKDRPIVVFLDDILWADAASLQLLHYFCRRIREQRIMVVAAYRDVELPEDHPLSRLLLDLNRERILRQIALSKLTTDHVAQIISNNLGGGSVAPEFAKLIYSRTGGNPFFVEEVLRSLVEEARIYKSDEGWTLREIAQVEIPSSVRALIKQRMSRLGDDAMQILSIGAVMGMDFGYELLRRVTFLEEDKLISELERAVRAGLVRERRSPKEVSYIFADEQIRDFLYDELSLIRGRKIHTRIAQAMEELYQTEKNRHLEEFAHHYVQAGDVTKATEFSLMAGDRAAKLYAWPEAKKHYRNVLDLLEEEQWSERLEVSTKIGDASFRTGEYQECLRYYGKAVVAARHLGQNRKIAQLYSKLGYLYWHGYDKQGALENLKEGLKVLEEEHDTVEEATICQNIGRLLVNTGEVETGLQWCQKAIEIARKLNAHEVLAQALQTLAIGLSPNRKNKADIFRYLEDSLSISTQHGLEDPACRAYVNLGSTYHHIKSDYAKAKETYLKGVEYTRKIGFPNYEAFIEAELALYAYIPLGEWNKAMEVANHSLRIGSELGELHVPKSLTPLAFASLFQGNVDRAEEYLSRAYPLAEKSQWTEIIYNCCWALGKLYIQKNNLERAEQYLLRGIEAGSQSGLGNLSEIYFELFTLYCLKNDLEKAREFYERIRSDAEELDEKWVYAFERWAYGLLASMRKDWNEAKDAFKRSSELWSELKHPYHHAQTVLEFGKALSNSGDGEEAKKWIEEARRVFTQLGARLDLSKLEIES